jgi:release factor glutamine methyltransferase
MTDAAVIEDIVRRLRAAGCVYAEDEARLLMAAAGSRAAAEAMVERRIDGTPLEQILGWVEFCGMRIAVEPGVFVPRRRTEFLVAQAIQACSAGDVVVDLCCGCGAVGAAVAAAVPGIELHAVDVDPVAVRCARRNLPGHAVHAGDLYGALPPTLHGRVEVLVANAPYVPTDSIPFMPAEARLYEPRVALDGGADGVHLHRRIAADAGRWLTAGGTLLIETSEPQVRATVEAFRAGGFDPRVMRAGEVGATVVSGRIGRSTGSAG